MRTHLLFLALFLAAVLGTHFAYFDLPLFWDELGFFVPAAKDLFQQGAWIPTSTAPNSHPPAVMAYLAAVWSVTGFSIPAGRAAMLVLAGLGVYLAFLLAVRLCRETPRAPAIPAAGFLLASPLFFAQAMLMQLDMPAMVVTLGALLLFLERRYLASALVCCLLVLVKETSVSLPAVFGLWLLVREKRPREALYFVLPLAPLALWFFALYRTTGHWFGDSAYSDYNLAYALHPVRVIVALQRRFYYLFVESFHWIGAVGLALAWVRTRVFQTREWEVTAWAAGAHIVTVSVLGGATLERYLMPVLPLLYIAFAAALATLSGWRAVASQTALTLGLIGSLFLNPLHPFPYENNLALVDFVELHKSAASYLERNFPNVSVATAWPLTDALKNPEFGYVEIPFEVIETSNFHAASIAALPPKARVLVLYSRNWEPERGPQNVPWIRRFLERYYGFEAARLGLDAAYRLGFRPVMHFERRGQWIEICVKI